MNYRRKIVGRAQKTEDFVQVKRAKSHKHGDVVTYTGTFRVSNGWRLECGHTISGAQGQGKKATDCHYCEWKASHPNEKFAGYADANLSEWNLIT